MLLTSKQAKPPSKRNSVRNSVQVRTFDLDQKTVDGQTRSTKEKKATEAVPDKQRARTTRDTSSGVSPLSSKSQAELDKRPLGPIELEAMLLGAPYFGVRKTGEVLIPEVTFKGGNMRISRRYATDFAAFSHATFGTSTLRLTKSKEEEARDSVDNGTETNLAKHDVVEIPDMLSANGVDAGAVGFEHYLQLPISDDLAPQDSGSTQDKRKQILLDPEWLGLREIDMEYMIDRLTEMGELYAAIKQHQYESPDPWNRNKIEEMGEELFERLLSGELGATGVGTGSVALKTQISALQRVLSTKALWRDFSNPEWRTRLGQLLWAPEDFDEPQFDGKRLPSERDVLLLQITLSAELLMRLLALEALSFSFPPAVSPEDAEQLESQRTKKIKWDLVLAERFLDNVTISAKVPSESDKKANRSSFFSAITFFSAKESVDDLEPTVQPLLFAKNETEQLDGLAQFATTIHWPHASDVRTELGSKLSRTTKQRPISTAASLYATPLSSPRITTTPGTRNSFFGFGNADGSRPTPRPGFSRKTTAQSISLLPARNIGGNVESFEVGGWLSRSWLSGLVMPGEAARHFLISALLENSPQAITALGDEANLYGGFVYEGRGFWSKSCVVGRVLAAGKGSTECMGWISVEQKEVPEEGWIGVDVREVPNANATARIKDGEAVAKDSDPIRGHKIESLQAGDFARPADGPLVMGNEVKYEGISFSTTTKDSDGEETSTAILTFTSPANAKLPAVQVPLTYDVHFISSHPCNPQSTRPRTQSRPLTPSPQLSFETPKDNTTTSSSIPTFPAPPSRHRPQDSTFSSSTPTAAKKSHPSNPSASSSTASFAFKEKELPSVPAHPLHIDFSFSTIPVATLLSLPQESRPRALSSPTERKLSIAATAGQGGMKTVQVSMETFDEIVVLDCRGCEDLEVLARAWCAKVGESALIGKSGRTCVACCVREARGLGVGVVIRI
jgi:hypothetical protein